MLEWLASNLGTILISAGLIVIVALIIRLIVKDKKAGISSCGAKCGVLHKVKSRGLFALCRRCRWEHRTSRQRINCSFSSGLLRP